VCDEYLGRFPEASATPWVDRGICLHHAGDRDAAEASFRRALALAPDDPLVMVNVASLLAERDQFEQAQSLLERAVAREPANAYALSLLAHCRAQLCTWDGIETLHERIAQSLQSSREAVNAFALLSTPLSPELQLRAARLWSRDLEPAGRAARPMKMRSRGKRLRLGYVSSDFRTHATAFLLTEVWERHDRARIETYAYSIGPAERSPLRDRIERAFEHFVEVSGEAVEGIGRRIEADGIEVLIDLNGYTTHAKSELFALRAAPVQINWLGYLGTLGAPWYDFVLTDRFAAPPELQRYFSERFLYLPDCYCPSDTRRAVAASALSRTECGLPEGARVFCCFNQAYKILPEVFAVWMRLLGQVPGSVLWLSPANATARQNLRREAAVRGIAPERIVFAPRVELAQHLARHVHADLFLDTTPYNAGTTANDALFMAVPVLTCAGETLASRVAGSQLRAIGLAELVTTDLAGYEALALALARDPVRLAQYRARLQANRHSAPLFDMARFARALDDLLQAAWENRASAMANSSTPV
jgi:predicted O-linked N-acetylglucosamine transferase (SPINDLY family)